jgi:hypothetical protein
VKNRSSPACKRHEQRASPSSLSKFTRKEKGTCLMLSLMRCLKEPTNRKRITKLKEEMKEEKQK